MTLDRPWTPQARWKRGVAVLGLLAAGSVTALAGGWGALALAFAGPGGESLRSVLGGAFGALTSATLIAMFFRSRRWPAFGAWLVLFAALLVWWGSIEPSNDRDWKSGAAWGPTSSSR